MKLLTKAIEARLPRLGDTEATDLEDKMLVVKYFTPDAQWTWYGVEFDPDSQEFFGYVEGLEPEWGYFTLADLGSIRGALGLPVERDLYWEPITFRDLRRKA